MARYKIAVYTLIDITATGIVNSHQENSKPRNQQRNWETVLQVVGLRTQPKVMAYPASPKIVSTTQHDFGDVYQGQQKCWKFLYIVEQETNPLDVLDYDLDRVPIIAGLDETITLPMPLFFTKGEYKNIYGRLNKQLD